MTASRIREPARGPRCTRSAAVERQVAATDKQMNS